MKVVIWNVKNDATDEKASGVFTLTGEDIDDPSFITRFRTRVVPHFSKVAQGLWDGTTTQYSFEHHILKEPKDWYEHCTQQFDWDLIKSRIESSEWEEAECGDHLIRSEYIGTVMGQYPSGKYYQPFACSNVYGCIEPCREGLVANPAADEDRHRVLSSQVDKLVERCLEQYGTYMKWPGAYAAQVKELRDLRDAVSPELLCPVCEGCCSREAKEDELWREAMEEIADSHGLYFQHGEGDPCDLLLTQCKEKEDDE
jgi:hypothetical protein